MTEIIRCGRCSFMLYFGETISKRLRLTFSTARLIEQYDGRCPRCNAALAPEELVSADTTQPGLANGKH